MRLFFLIVSFSILLCSPVYADEFDNLSFSGALKTRAVQIRYPEHSIFNEFSGEEVYGGGRTDNSVNLRLNAAWDVSSQWGADIHYEVETRHSEALDVFSDSLNVFQEDSLPSDDKRLMNLTQVFGSGGERASFHRLDRLSINFQGNQNVLKIGRQAISWGNGMMYSPMDFFNPFDPTLIDTEYKSGDDMLYAQRLFSNGDDAQLVYVARRNKIGDLSGNESSLAMKYHGFVGESEFDLLLSQHYNDEVLALGAVHSLGGTVVRGDIVATRVKPDSERVEEEGNTSTFVSLVANLSYSWVSWGKNMSGVFEYFHNGFGLAHDDYNVIALQQKSELFERISRGELFTLGKNYVALSVLVEASPLWLLTPNMLINGDDGSGLFQLVSQHDITQDIQVSAALSFPFGEDGSEFGGLEISSIGSKNKYVSYTSNIYVQASWYF
ncbi:MAG: hypothetical protein K6L80_06560 [Agarilytica sp.]